MAFCIFAFCYCFPSSWGTASFIPGFRAWLGSVVPSAVPWALLYLPLFRILNGLFPFLSWSNHPASTSETQGLQVPGVCHHRCFLWCWKSNSEFHETYISTLLTELYAQPLIRLLKLRIDSYFINLGNLSAGTSLQSCSSPCPQISYWTFTFSSCLLYFPSHFCLYCLLGTSPDLSCRSLILTQFVCVFGGESVVWCSCGCMHLSVQVCIWRPKLGIE